MIQDTSECPELQHEKVILPQGPLLSIRAPLLFLLLIPPYTPYPTPSTSSSASPSPFSFSSSSFPSSFPSDDDDGDDDL